MAAWPDIIPDEIRARLTAGSGGCWAWTGSVQSKGYAQRRVAGRKRLVHREVYEVLRGAIPATLQIDHLCRNKRCVNPDHLEPVTARENGLRARCAQLASLAPEER